ncbi:FAD/NAD(P)-binding domain-containing protein [Polyplosphaeria fusca]|uniref:FAD/NAD(P)-binding domain-containing protein n=1 Tax=Polyplosphaeria fusca TaxID=682080 RepID=A0A9P4QHT8_9PLEO|nr:FAD/NAD(P)-binding domain-containing protein [Polyplosphaeria fusca]
MQPRNVNLHPPSYHPSSLVDAEFDVIFIGSGPVANYGAARLTRTGLTVLAVEAELYGGDCPFWACVPSKALLRPIEALAAANAVDGAREMCSKGVDVNSVFARRDRFVLNWKDDFIANLATGNGITVVRGWGRIEGTKRVSVQPHGEEDRYLFEARHAVVLATGSESYVPEIKGLEHLDNGSERWDPRHVTSSNYVPAHLIILGAGAVGTEAATTYAGLGGKVTLLSAGVEIMPGIERHAAELVRKGLIASGVDVRLSARATEIRRHGSGPSRVEVLLSTGETIRGSTVLVATGRRAKTVDLDLEKLSLSQHFAPGLPAPTNDSLCVETEDNEKWLYAIGDTNGRNMTTHSGVYHARIASNAILSHLANILSPSELEKLIFKNNITETRLKSEPIAIPKTIFTSPTVATVGHTLSSALDKGIKANQVSVDFSFPGAPFPGAWLWADGEYGHGWASWIIDVDEQILVGATYVGHQVEELLVPATFAISNKTPMRELVHVVPCFPTRGEVWRFLLEQAGY